MKRYWVVTIFVLVTLFLSACGNSSTPGLPDIKSFTATPNSLGISGDETTLSWDVSGASTLELDQGIGTVTGTSKKVTVTENKTFILTASNTGGSVTKTASVAVAASSLYVNPAEGDDSSTGTKTQPFKTIKQALSRVKAGEEIVLVAGTYSGASGESWNYILPDGVTIKANSDGVVLVGNGSPEIIAFNIAGKASLEYLSFREFGVAVKATTGEVSLPGVQFMDGGVWLEGNPSASLKDAVFTNSHLYINQASQVSLENTQLKNSSLSLQGTSSATVKTSTFEDFSTAVYMQGDTQATVESSEFKNGTYAFYLNDNAHLTMMGGRIHDLGSGDCGAGVGFYVPGSSSNQEQQTVSLESVFMENIHGNALSVSSRATVSLKNADIRSSGQKSCGNSTNLEVSNPGAVFTLENSSISNSLGNGLMVYDGQVTIKNSDFSGNANSGLVVLKGTANIEASEFRGNTIGLYFGGVGKVRGSSFQYNKTGLYAFGAVDLGIVSQPGNNTFTLNTDYGIRVGSSALTVMAVGNTWIANEQGADSQGKYANQLFTGPITGKNYVLETVNQKIQF